MRARTPLPVVLLSLLAASGIHFSEEDLAIEVNESVTVA